MASTTTNEMGETQVSDSQKAQVSSTNRHIKCNGHICFQCGRCRDWYYAGDNWNHIRNWKHWSDPDWSRYLSDHGDWKNWKRHDNVTCTVRHHRYGFIGHGYHDPCICQDNVT